MPRERGICCKALSTPTEPKRVDPVPLHEATLHSRDLRYLGPLLFLAVPTARYGLVARGPFSVTLLWYELQTDIDYRLGSSEPRSLEPFPGCPCLVRPLQSDARGQQLPHSSFALCGTTARGSQCTTTMISVIGSYDLKRIFESPLTIAR
ncbi:uncharacterized protein K460DRAFT_199854 [Cucurbitaria berberidis CBS 394.84]|uniref:Uncharacterized protein n=1 Tax=Cucurbitaria berberidis CBS 394.84 TaxID=1168544 RepID=A0A9P4G9H4_9PLEO|nr:uncharacterized protein K460DRAFT_199854 [Cucurbitaria berberidis CBS 394.84]KAF1841165.1 hypothetical protein K460DRAFT_199854 [Cucurbitaria berberidis CBS 394.84]